MNSRSTLSPVLQGKNVIVTGAGAGLGRAYALHAARSGAAVGVNDIDSPRAGATVGELKEEGFSALPLPGDMSNWDGAEQVIGSFVSEYGRIDGLVSNAGVYYECLPWEDTAEDIARLIKTNLFGVFFGGVHALRVMIKQGSGSIVNVISGSQIGLPKMGAYGASKGGVASLTYSWAIDLQGTGVRVNAVSPLAKTNISGRRPHVRVASRPPLPQPEHVAPLVTYMLSDSSSSLMGQVLRLEGPHLSIMKHPSISDILVSRESWTVEDIAAAVAGPLSGEIQHVGRD